MTFGMVLPVADLARLSAHRSSLRPERDPEPQVAAAVGPARSQAVATRLSESVAGAPLTSGSRVVAGAGAVDHGSPGQADAPPALVVLRELQRAMTGHVPDNLDDAFIRDERISRRLDETPKPGAGAVSDDLWGAYSRRLVDWRRLRARGEGTIRDQTCSRGMRRRGVRAAAGQDRREEGRHQRGVPAACATSATILLHAAIVAYIGRGVPAPR